MKGLRTGHRIRKCTETMVSITDTAPCGEAIRQEVTEENRFWRAFEYFSYHVMKWLLKALAAFNYFYFNFVFFKCGYFIDTFIFQHQLLSSII